MSKMLNVAVIGTGAMGKNHARVYSMLDSVHLAAVCDINKKAANALAREYHARAYSDIDELLKKEKLDAVSICVPTILHKETALKCIEKRIHILVEKPIATNKEEAKEIIKAAKKNAVTVAVGHIERFNPVIIELKKRIVNNELGRILKVHCQRLSLFPQRIIDVGVVIDLAIHEIDILRYLIDSKIRRVYAETGQCFHQSNEDLLIGTIRFENDVVGVIHANWLTPKKVREIAITGEKGMFVANYLTQELYFYEKKYVGNVADYSKEFIRGTEGKKINIKIERQEPLMNELKAFVGSILGNKKPPVTAEEGMEALIVAQRLLESAKKNKVMTL